MELDVFKTAWKQLAETGETAASRNEIFDSINRESAATVGSMKRNLLLGVVAVVLLYGTITVFFLLEFAGKYWPVAGFMFLTGIFYLIYLKMKNDLLGKLFSNASDVTSNMVSQVQTLQRYIRFYIIAGTIQFPTTIIFLVVVFISRAAITTSAANRLTIFFTSSEGIAAIAASFILLIVSCYYLNRWYVNRLYGKHLKHLRQVVAELKEDVAGVQDL